MRTAAKHIRFTPEVKDLLKSLLKLDFNSDQISNHLYLHDQTRISHVSSRHTDIVTDAVIRMFKSLKDKVLTITADNSKEFSGHKQI